MPNALGYQTPTQLNTTQGVSQNAPLPPSSGEGNTNNLTYGDGSQYEQQYEAQFGHVYDPRIGSGPLPGGIYGSRDSAYVRDVTPNELVSTQLNNLQDSNSAYMKNAERNGMNVANQRGLLNSSLAAQSSQKAALDAALPVAQQDAAAYGTAASENEKYLNEMALAASSRAAGRAGAGAQLAAARMQEEGALQRQREALAFQGEQQGLDRAFTGMRDYYLHQYDMQNDTHHTDNTIRLNGNTMQQNLYSYAQHTGIDMRAQRATFFNNLMSTAMENPDLFTPEVIGGVMNMYLPVQDDFNAQMDQYFQSMGWS